MSFSDDNTTGFTSAAATPQGDAAESSSTQYMYARLGQAYLDKELYAKQELAAAAFLWLVGCPILCVTTAKSDSVWGLPDQEKCGLYSYSISASMTGHYPKIFGSVVVPLVALLVVQRSSAGLCGILKLGWMARFSKLIPVPCRIKSDEAVNDEEEDQRRTALKLWKYIEKIEFLGYAAGAMLIGLVAFDAKQFLLTHLLLALLAFFLLYRQNYLVGTLGKEFPSLFPNWTYSHGQRIFRLGFVHLVVILVLPTMLGFIDGFNRCDDLAVAIKSLLSVFGFNDDTESMNILAKIASAVVWSNEYAFVVLYIYIQLLQHFELRLWEFAGGKNMPFAVILSRFTLRGTIQSVILGSRDSWEADIFMGNCPASLSSSVVAEERPKKSKAQ